MLDRIRAFFSAEEPDDTVDERALHLAAAVLLVEVAKADHSFDQAEFDNLQAVLREHWSLSDEDLADLVQVARDTADTHVSLHRQIELINTHFDNPQKFELMRGLWQIACADGKIHHHEEHLIRRLADLLYVSHTDFIRSKHLVLEES